MSALTLRLRLSGASIYARGLAAASQFASLTQPDRYAAGASHPDGFRHSPQTQNPYGVTKASPAETYTKTQHETDLVQSAKRKLVGVLSSSSRMEFVDSALRLVNDAY